MAAVETPLESALGQPIHSAVTPILESVGPAIAVDACHTPVAALIAPHAALISRQVLPLFALPAPALAADRNLPFDAGITAPHLFALLPLGAGKATLTAVAIDGSLAAFSTELAHSFTAAALGAQFAEAFATFCALTRCHSEFTLFAAFAALDAAASPFAAISAGLRPELVAVHAALCTDLWAVSAKFPPLGTLLATAVLAALCALLATAMFATLGPCLAASAALPLDALLMASTAAAAVAAFLCHQRSDRRRCHQQHYQALFHRSVLDLRKTNLPDAK
jgi:hypothetical protein